MHFLAAERLALLAGWAALAGAVWWLAATRRHTATRFADPDMWASAGLGRPRRVQALVTALLFAAVATGVVASARPVRAATQAERRSLVVVALDTSSSMLAPDVPPSRLAVATSAAADFIRSLPASVDVAVLTYNATVAVLTTATADHARAAAALTNLPVSGGTALGEAIRAGLAVIPSSFTSGPTSAARMVVLSDGGNTTGRAVDDALVQARARRVQVSTISYGTSAGSVTLGGKTTAVPVDPQQLAAVAAGTGGTAYRASTAAELGGIYRGIGRQLRRSPVQQDLTVWLVGLALVTAGTAGVISLLRTGRLA